jgi:hypothetical protein
MENDGAARGGAAEGAGSSNTRRAGNRGGNRPPTTVRFEGREPSLQGFILTLTRIAMTMTFSFVLRRKCQVITPSLPEN